jgi:hypothetical protein
MARYSPELLAAIRYRYEETDQPMNGLAADFEIGITTLQTLVRKNGWTPRSKRMRDCPPSMQLLEEAQALVTALPPHDEAIPTPTLPLAGGGSDGVPADSIVPMPVSATIAPALPHLSSAERLEALVEKEIAAEEAARAELGIRPRARNEAERCARTLSVLTQTLHTLKKLNPGGNSTGDYDDMPGDIDALREALAHRINAFVEGRIGSERMALNDQLAGLSDNEVRQLIEFGRERGMRVLLQPRQQQADEPD